MAGVVGPVVIGEDDHDVHAVEENRHVLDALEFVDRERAFASHRDHLEDTRNTHALSKLATVLEMPVTERIARK